MHPQAKHYLETFRAAFPHPAILTVFTILQTTWIFVALFPRSAPPPPILEALGRSPWYGWVIGWTSLFWLSTLSYAIRRKRSYDETSRNFFGAYLDHLIREGRLLFDLSGDEDFYFKANAWQRKAVEGIAIGLGAGEAEGFFQRMEERSSLAHAYDESKALGNGEPLCRALQGNLDELERMRRSHVPRPVGGPSDLATSELTRTHAEPNPRYLLK